MNLGEIREYVKEYVSLGDIPNSLIDTWIRMGVSRLNSTADWPWLYSLLLINTGYIGEDSVHNGNLVRGAQSIVSVTNISDDASPIDLRRISYTDGLMKYPNNNNAGQHPSEYSVIYNPYPDRPGVTSPGDLQVVLWPPIAQGSSTVKLCVRYKKTSDDWPVSNTADSDTPPLPEPFVPALINFVLHELLQREGQPDDARAQKSLFHQSVDDLRARFVASSGVDVRAGSPRNYQVIGY